MLEYFKDFSKDQTNKYSPTVNSNDIPLVMRVGFYLDNISFHEYKDEREELFNKPNAYKKIMSHLHKFLKLK